MKNIYRRILSLALAGIMVFAVLPLNGAAKTYILGDVDGNGKVDSSDALTVLRYSVGAIKSVDTKSADITKDGKVNSSDALAILQTAVGIKAVQKITEEEPVEHVARPIGKVTYTRSTSGTDFTAKIERLAYGAEQTLTINASNVANYNSQIVNYKTVKYWPMANVAVITPKSGKLLRFSKGTSPNFSENLAVNVGAAIAMNGTFKNGDDLYETKKAATVRDGAVYKNYAGTAGKAAARMVIYKNGDWKVVKNFDTETAKAEIAKGAWVSVRYQDVTVTNGQSTAKFKRTDKNTGREYYRFQNYLGHTYDGKIIFLTTEMMPTNYVLDILKAYNCKDAVQINGGNSSYMYVKGFGNTTGTTGASVKNLNKVGYLETEWFAVNGFLAAGKGGGPSYSDLDVVYFK